MAVTVGEDGALLTQAGTSTSDDAAGPHIPAGRGDAISRHLRCRRPVRRCRRPGAAPGGCTVRDAAEEAVEQAARFVTAGGAAGHSTFGGNNQVSLHASHLRRPRCGQPDRENPPYRRSRRRHRWLLRPTPSRPHHAARAAREQGDVLIVCLNSDASVRRAKGAGRPLVAERGPGAGAAGAGCRRRGRPVRRGHPGRAARADPARHLGQGRRLHRPRSARGRRSSPGTAAGWCSSRWSSGYSTTRLVRRRPTNARERLNPFNR